MPCVYPPQPPTLVPRVWTQPEIRGFGSDENRAYLKQQVLLRYNGAISDFNLLDVMQESVDYYLDRAIDATYSASTPEQMMSAVQMMNGRVLHRVGQLYGAQRAQTSLWLQLRHQPENMNSAMPQIERVSNLDGYDQELSL